MFTTWPWAQRQFISLPCSGSHMNEEDYSLQSLCTCFYTGTTITSSPKHLFCPQAPWKTRFSHSLWWVWGHMTEFWPTESRMPLPGHKIPSMVLCVLYSLLVVTLRAIWWSQWHHKLEGAYIPEWLHRMQTLPQCPWTHHEWAIDLLYVWLRSSVVCDIS
jgi:hypothetical protein